MATRPPIYQPIACDPCSGGDVVTALQGTVPWHVAGDFTVEFPTTVAVSGTVTADQGAAGPEPWPVTGDFTVAFPATQAVSGTVTALQGTTPWQVTGSVAVSGQDTLDVNTDLDVDNWDLAAALYTATVTYTESTLLDHLILSFTTREPRDITVTKAGMLLYTVTGDTSLERSIDFEDDGVPPGGVVVVTVGQTAGACLLDVLLTSKSGGTVLGAAPVLGAGTAHVGSFSQDVGDSPVYDAFGRQRVSMPETLVEITHVLDTTVVTQQTVAYGDGTATHLPAEAALRLTIGGTSGHRMVEQTRKYQPYQTGKSQQIKVTTTNGPQVAGISKRTGYFDDQDGVFFDDYQGLHVNLRSSTGAGSSRVPQASWNIDPMDGTGPSGVVFGPGLTYDSEMAVHFIIDLQWLAVGRVRVGFQFGGVDYYVHQFVSSGLIDRAYMRAGQLPVRWEIVNVTASAGGSMKAICGTVLAEGGHDTLGYLRSANSGITGRTVAATREPLISIRLKTTYGGVTFRGALLPASLDLMASTDVLWELILNATLGPTPSWASVGAQSAMEYDIASDTATGGIVIASGYKASGSGVVTTPVALDREFLVVSPDGTTSDTLTLAATSISGNATCRGALGWREER